MRVTSSGEIFLAKSTHYTVHGMYMYILVETGYVPSMGNGLVSVVDVDTEKDAYCVITRVHVLLSLFLCGGRERERERASNTKLRSAMHRL